MPEAKTEIFIFHEFVECFKFFGANAFTGGNFERKLMVVGALVEAHDYVLEGDRKLFGASNVGATIVEDEFDFA